MANHSESYCYDPEEYVELYYKGTYPNNLEEELMEWIKDKIHDIFAEGKTFQNIKKQKLLMSAQLITLTAIYRFLNHSFCFIFAQFS